MKTLMIIPALLLLFGSFALVPIEASACGGSSGGGYSSDAGDTASSAKSGYEL